MYFDRERHVFEGFYVPDSVCRCLVGTDERCGLRKKERGWRGSRREADGEETKWRAKNKRRGDTLMAGDENFIISSLSVNDADKMFNVKPKQEGRMEGRMA